MDWNNRRITSLLQNALLEDRANYDATTHACIDANQMARATLIAKQDCILAGLDAVPKIFEKDGYQFFFYSNEHRPIHVHVRRGGGEAVFEVEQGVELRESQGLKVRELAKAQELATQHLALIIQKWHERFNR